MIGGRLEAYLTVPSSTTVAATNSGGTATSVSLTAGSYTPTSYLAHVVTRLNAARPALHPMSSAANMAAAAGYGTWSAGWLCDDASGNLVASFGTPTLTATALTYGNAGPRADGNDLAIGFSTTSGVASGGDVYDVTATDDLCIAMLVKFSSVPPSDSAVVGKYVSADTDRWRITATGGGIGRYQMLLTTSSSTTTVSTSSIGAALHAGEWHVLMGCVDRGTGKFCVGSRSLSGTTVMAAETTAPAGTYANASSFTVGQLAGTLGPSTLMQVGAVAIGVGTSYATGMSANLSTALTNVVNAINATWSGSLSTGTSGTGLVTLDSTDISGNWALTFTTAAAGTALGFVGDIAARSTAATGTLNARGLWLPGCPLNMMGRPSSAPEASDMRSTESPTGDVVSLVGSYRYEHEGLRWSHVSQAKTWEGSAASTGTTTTYESWETWVRDTQIGRGHAWFGIGSAFQVYWDSAGTDVIVGADLNGGVGPTAGWKASPPIARVNPMRVDASWLGMWAIEIPRIVSSG